MLPGVPVPPPRYGHDYRFRVRLADLTGGGPKVHDAPVHPGLVPIGTCPFRRFLPPKALEVECSPATPPLSAKPAPVRTITKLVVRRPHIGYPEAIFAGVPAATFEGASLDALVAAALAAGRAIGVADPMSTLSSHGRGRDPRSQHRSPRNAARRPRRHEMADRLFGRPDLSRRERFEHDAGAELRRHPLDRPFV